MATALNFVLNDFSTDLQSTVSASLPGGNIPGLTTSNGITAVYEVDVQVFRNVFQIHVDAQDITNDLITSTSNLGDIKYYVDNNHYLNVATENSEKNWPTTYIVNPANAQVNYTGLTDTTYLTDTTTAAFSDARMFAKHDYIRWLAQNLFGTYHGVDLFNNEAEVAENLSAQGALVWTQLIKYKLDYVNTESTKTGMIGEYKPVTTNTNNYAPGVTNKVAANFLTNTTTATYAAGSGYNPASSETVTNVCKVLFDQMMGEQPLRFQNISGTAGLAPYAPNSANVATTTRTGENYIGDGGFDRMPLPFIAGDTITFQMTFKSVADQYTLTSNSSLTADSDLDRTFNIKFKLKDAAISNTTPTDTGSSYNSSYVA
ncbi:MAG: hypothetical protein CXT73_05590 [Methanobacteriota archaeon]|jgi:hypothetical protein|nr:MAG: hypothetical protein CXT73_05590 [Euryarchaeota archaeon]